MKVELDKPTYLQGSHYDKGDTLDVSDRLGSAWIQTGIAHEISGKKSIRTPDREQANEGGGADQSIAEASRSDDE